MISLQCDTDFIDIHTVVSCKVKILPSIETKKGNINGSYSSFFSFRYMCVGVIEVSMISSVILYGFIT